MSTHESANVTPERWGVSPSYAKVVMGGHTWFECDLKAAERLNIKLDEMPKFYLGLDEEGRLWAHLGFSDRLVELTPRVTYSLEGQELATPYRDLEGDA